MKTTVLRREPLRIPETPGELLAAAQSAMRDGSPNAELLQSNSQTLIAMGCNLGEQVAPTFFAELDIEPFTDESVEVYQEAERNRLQQSTWRGHLRERLPNVFESLGTLVTGVGAIGTALGVIFTSEHLYNGLDANNIIMVSIGGASLLLTGILLQQSPNWQWIRRPYSDYRGDVPDGVRALAARVLEHSPAGMTLEVESLAKNPRTSVDPFLIVRYGAKQYRVAAWGEASYTATFA